MGFNGEKVIIFYMPWITHGLFVELNYNLSKKYQKTCEEV
jgi:hypothetical protein